MHGNLQRKLLLFFFLLYLVLFFPSIGLSPTAQGDENVYVGEKKRREHEEKKAAPNAVERAIGIAGFNAQWDTFSTSAKLAWMNLLPPADSGNGQKVASGAGKKMKEASKRIFEANKETMEQTAAAVARMAEEAVGMTKEMLMKMAVSNSHGDQPDAEL